MIQECLKCIAVQIVMKSYKDTIPVPQQQADRDCFKFFRFIAVGKEPGGYASIGDLAFAAVGQISGLPFCRNQISSFISPILIHPFFRISSENSSARMAGQHTCINRI